jgi:hypothetical protein
MTDHDDSIRATARALTLTVNMHQVYALCCGGYADSPPSVRRLASKFCFYPLFTE